MNIGLIIPAKSSKRRPNIFSKFSSAIGTRLFAPLVTDTNRIEIQEGVDLFVCSVPHQEDKTVHEGYKKRIKSKLDRIFEDNNVWPVFEHPGVEGVYNSQTVRFRESMREIAIRRFPEILKLLHGVGDLSTKEVLVTGSSYHLEHAISKLIMNVKCLNILLPEGNQEPDEAEMAFLETGIPIHMTSDSEVLDRVAVWLRFPDDDESFDVLPAHYKGLIVDLGDMKIIDTKNQKIFNIVLEFSDRIKRKIGHSILDMWSKGALESVIGIVCANAWDISVTEASLRLGIRLSFKS